MTELLVWWRRELVGSLRHAHDDTMEFLYDRHWAESPTAFPISLSMPVRTEPYRSEANSFFAKRIAAKLPGEATSGSTRKKGDRVSERLRNSCAGMGAFRAPTFRFWFAGESSIGCLETVMVTEKTSH